MIKFSIYSNLSKKTIRLISLIAIIILILANIANMGSIKNNPRALFMICQNTLVIILAIILIIFPAKLMFISIISYQYALSSLYSNPKDIMSLFMLILTISVLLVRGFFNKHKYKKIIGISLPILALYLSGLRFGIDVFLYGTINKVGYLFVLALILFFIINYQKSNEKQAKKVLNLAEYPNLKKRDADWLATIQKKEKYEWLAIEYKMSIGSIKNRLKIIFNTLEVGDKIGFLNKYSEYEIIFEDPVFDAPTSQ